MASMHKSCFHFHFHKFILFKCTFKIFKQNSKIISFARNFIKLEGELQPILG